MPRLLAVAFCALAAVARAEGIPADLLEKLRDEDPSVRLDARDAIRALGPAARPDLEALSRGDNLFARLASTILADIAFDEAVARLLTPGDTWFRLDVGDKKGAAFVRLSAKKTDTGYALSERLYLDSLAMVQEATTDRDLNLLTVKTVLGVGANAITTTATFDGETCEVKEGEKTNPIAYAGTPFTDWSILRFAPAFVARPPAEEIVAWDSSDSSPATTRLHVEEAVHVDGPAGAGIRGIPVRVEGLMTVYVLEDGRISHATRGSNRLVVPCEEKDVPAAFKK